MAPDLVRLIARRNVHGHEKKKESIQPPPVPDWVPVPSAAWVPQQEYLHPYPKELTLRNYV
jgi:uncharacterized protein YbgA (DUF1722 family)